MRFLRSCDKSGGVGRSALIFRASFFRLWQILLQKSVETGREP